MDCRSKAVGKQGSESAELIADAPPPAVRVKLETSCSDGRPALRYVEILSGEEPESSIASLRMTELLVVTASAKISSSLPVRKEGYSCRNKERK
jgi:hypothetical protein